MTAPHSGDPREGSRGRPGAMTVAMNAASHAPHVTVLRIGVVQQGRIVLERFVGRAGKVSIGSRETNDIVVSGPGMARSLLLFEGSEGRDGEEFSLRIAPGMTGRLAATPGFISFDELRKQRGLTSDEAFSYPLPYRARGKLSLGDVSVLFEVVEVPHFPSRPQLPASVRGNFVKSIDWLFTAFVIFSFLGHFGFVVYLENADFPLPDPQILVRDFAPDLLILPPPPPPIDPAPQHHENETADVRNEGKGPKRNTPSAPPSSGQHEGRGRDGDQAPSSDDIARMTAQARQDALHAMLGALGGEGSVVGDLLKDGAALSDAAEIFAQVQGAVVAQNSDVGLLSGRRPSMDDARTTGLGTLAASGHGGELATGGPLVEGEIKRVHVSLGVADDIGGIGELDAAFVTAEIKRRIGAVRACYEQGLRRNGTLQGKINVSLTIEENGSVSHVVADEDTLGDPQVTRCVENAIRATRFRTGPKGGAVTFAYPFVFAPQN